MIHNKDIAFEAIQITVDKLQNEFHYKPTSFPDESYGTDFLSVTNGDIIITIFFDPREGVSLFITKVGNTFDKRKGYINFLNEVFPLFSEEQKLHSEKYRMLLEEFQPRSKQFYLQSLNLQIKFIQEHFPDLVEKGNSDYPILT